MKKHDTKTRLREVGFEAQVVEMLIVSKWFSFSVFNVVEREAEYSGFAGN